MRGLEDVPTLAELNNLLHSERERWARLVKEIGLQPE